MSRVLLDMNYYLKAKQNGIVIPNMFENIHSMIDNMAIKRGIDLDTYSVNRGSKGMTSIEHDFESLNKSWEQKMTAIQQSLANQNVIEPINSLESEQYSKVHH